MRRHIKVFRTQRHHSALFDTLRHYVETRVSATSRCMPVVRLHDNSSEGIGTTCPDSKILPVAQLDDDQEELGSDIRKTGTSDNQAES